MYLIQQPSLPKKNFLAVLKAIQLSVIEPIADYNEPSSRNSETDGHILMANEIEGCLSITC